MRRPPQTTQAKEALKVATPVQLRAARKAYAQKIDDTLLKLESSPPLKTTDPVTTLQIKYALPAESLRTGLEGKVDFDELKAVDLKKVVLTNGFQSELAESFSLGRSNDGEPRKIFFRFS